MSKFHTLHHQTNLQIMFLTLINFFLQNNPPKIPQPQKDYGKKILLLFCCVKFNFRTTLLDFFFHFFIFLFSCFQCYLKISSTLYFFRSSISSKTTTLTAHLAVGCGGWWNLRGITFFCGFQWELGNSTWKHQIFRDYEVKNWSFMHSI